MFYSHLSWVFNFIVDSCKLSYQVFARAHTHTHTKTRANQGVASRGPHPVTSPANRSADSRWQPSKGGAAAGESINIPLVGT